MARYELEAITKKGNKIRPGASTLTETRKKACRMAKKEDCVVYIRKWENYWHTIEHIFYDPKVSSYDPELRSGFYLQKTSGNSRRYRVSPKTGNLLDVSRTIKYLGK